ncbi:MAG: TonB-dependent receptor domain-containing protein, partial [Luteibaculum sp.]
FTGTEFQPSVRLAYFLKPLSFVQSHMLWTAFSRAVRLPSRLDADITVEGVDFMSERVYAYELGYRLKAGKLSLSVSSFFNHYKNLRSLDSNPDTTSVFPTLVANSQFSDSWGVEIFGNYQILDNWRIRGGISFFENVIWSANDRVLEVSKEFESVDPKNTIRLQSISNLGKGWQLDATFKHTSHLPEQLISQRISEYSNMDVRLAKKYKSAEVSVVGRNLFRPRTQELSALIPRSVYLRFTISLR